MLLYIPCSAYVTSNEHML